MAIQCPTLRFFNIYQDQALLLATIEPFFHKTQDNYETLYNKIIQSLQDQGVFKFGKENFTQKQQDAYRKSMLDLKNTLIDLSTILLKHKNDSKYTQNLVNLINNQLYSDAGLTTDEINIIEQPSIHSIEGINEDVDTDNIKLTLKTALNQVYGSSYGALQARESEFNINLIRATIIDIDNDIIVSDVNTLNRSIGNYKNTQYASIVRYLKSINQDYNFSEELFDKNGFVTKEYNKVMNIFENFLEIDPNFSSTINREWLNQISSGKNSLLLQATNAYVNLKYFDLLLKDKLGQVIELKNEDLINSQIDLGFNKYVFGKINEHKVKHWGTNDFRDALKNISKFSKLILSTIKIYSSLDGKFQNNYVNIQNFSNAITRLFTKVRQLDKSKFKGLKQIVNKFHSNPYYYSTKLFEELNNIDNLQGLIGSKDFTRLDYDILISVFKEVFDTNNDKSILSIETRLKKKNFSVGRYSIIDSINGVIDRTMQASYLQTKFDSKVGYKTEIKPKFDTGRSSKNLIKTINLRSARMLELDRKLLLEKYEVTQNANTEINFNIGKNSKSGNLGINFIANFKDGVLSNTCDIKCDNPELFGQVFHPHSTVIDFSEKSIQRIIDNQNLNKQETLFRDVLEFIDNFLGLNLLSEQGLQTLNIFKSYLDGKNNYIKEILQYAIKSAAVNKYQHEFNEEIKSGTYSSQFEFEKFMDRYFGNVDRVTKLRTFFQKVNGYQYLKVIGNESDFVDIYSTSLATLSGDSSKSTTKNFWGDQLGNYRTSFLGGNIEYYLNKYRQKSYSGASNLLFSKVDNLIKDVVIDTDIQARNGEVKSVRDMKAGELIYSHIINNFFGTYISTDDKNPLSGCFIIQPTTYSDKVTPINYAIYGDKKIELGDDSKSYFGKTIAQLTPEENIDLYIDTVGKAYKDSYVNILNTYRKLYGDLLSENQIRELLSQETEDTILQKVNNFNKINPNNRIELKKEVHYRANKDGSIKLNELYYHYANVLHNKQKFIERLNLEKIEFIKDILDAGVSFYTNYASDETSVNEKHPIQKILNSNLFTNQQRQFIKENWIHNGKLIIAKTLDGKNIYYKKDLKGLADITLNPILEKYFYTDVLLSNNLRFALTGTEAAHPDKSNVNIESELNAQGINIYNGETLGLVKTINGKKVITNDLIDLAKSNDSRVQTAYNNLIKKIEAVAQGTQFKRNVIVPGTLQYMQMNALNGISSKIKVAVIDDVQAAIWNFRGDGAGSKPKTEDAHDGSALENPFISILENLSLQDQEVGVDKKPIWHSFDDDTMSAVLLKFAVFTMTNERMRASMHSKISLYNMFKKMTDIKWFNPDGSCNFTRPNGISDAAWEKAIKEFNLINTIGFKSRKGAKIDFATDVLQGESLYYKQGDTHMQIFGFGYDENGYYTKEREAKIDGSPISMGNDATIIYYHRFDENSNHYKYTKDQLSGENVAKGQINSLFQLFNVFGGIYSESLSNDELKFSEKSSFVVVNLMNNISIRTNEKDTARMDQVEYYQPLKDMMISYAANPSAMKVGSANINPVTSWEDNTELQYMTMDADGLGIQMDADHDIDEAEMTEFTQVISALEAGGRLHDVAQEVYSQLGELAAISSQMEIDAVNNFVKYVYDKTKTEDQSELEQDQVLYRLKSQMYDILGRAIIHNYSPNNEKFDLGQPIIEEVSKKFNIHDNHALDSLKLAFSDSNLFDSVISTFMSNINKKSIKRQYAGSGCVMCPGFNIIQLYKIHGNSFQFDDLIDKAWELNESQPFFNQYDPSIDNLTDYNNKLVKAYLNILQLEEYKNSDLTLTGFIPTDIVDVLKVNEDGSVTKLGELNFENIDFYYKCKFQPNFLEEYLNIPKGTQLQFAQNITTPRNLAPARITWVQNGVKTNIFDTEEVANSFGYSTQKWVGQFNTQNINPEIYSLKETIEPRADNPNLRKKVLHIRLKGKEDIGEFTLVADTPKDSDSSFTGAYSIHFKTRSREDNGYANLKISTPSERQLLYNALYEAIPVGAEVSTWGALTEDGIKAINRFGKRFKKFGEREVTDKSGNPVKIGVYRKIKQDQKAIQKVFDDLDKGLYHGQEISDFKNLPAELVMSNLYASKFGTDLSLPEILEKGVKAFKKFTLPKIEIRNYDFCFTTRNNNNLYFTFGEVSSPEFTPKKRNWRIKIIGNDVYHVNSEGEKQFQVGAYVYNPNVQYDQESKEFFTEKGVLKDSSNFRVDDTGRVVEYKEYITQYSIFENIDGKINSHTVYKINRKNVKDSLEDAGNDDINAKIGSILNKIYTNGTYNGIRLNTLIKTANAQQMESVFTKMVNIMPERESQLLTTTLEYLKSVHSFHEKGKGVSNFYIDLVEPVNGKKYSKYLLEYYNSTNDAIYSSYLKSLYFTAARIPAQTLQSFMQMQLVGFTKSSKNICYVSHWQTYLQGSDYDIDKAYIMGLSFDDNGKYIGWSNLFDYSTLSTLEASEHLPLPKKVKYSFSNTFGVSIDNYIAKISDAFTPEEKILAYAELLKFLDKQVVSTKKLKVDADKNEKLVEDENSKDRYIYIKFDPKFKELGTEVLLNINRHASTNLTGEKLGQAVKNSISSKIQRIIQNPRNMDQAYTSIDGTMSTIRKSADLSPKGNKVAEMTMLNPLTKLVMQVSNMVGKGVIGITATGEKVFFNLSNYWNQGIRSNNEEWIKNLKFQNIFDRISGRAVGKLQSKVITTLANINFENVNIDEFKKHFSQASVLDSNLREKYGITNEDIIAQSENWKLYRSELESELKNIYDSDQFVDLNISALLSAATDNAKELILDRINAGTNLARCYIHLIMLGFSLDDIASFMVSPAVSLINELSSANVFDEYLYKVSITNAIDILRGDFPINKFFFGTMTSFSQEYDGESVTSSNGQMTMAKVAFARLYNLKLALIDLALQELEQFKLGKIKEEDLKYCKRQVVRQSSKRNNFENIVKKFGQVPILEEKVNDKGKVTERTIIAPVDYGSLKPLIKVFFRAKLDGDFSEDQTIESFMDGGSTRIKNNITAFSQYVETVINKIQETSQNITDFNNDLNEFEKLYELSDETSTLGSTFLKMNQGVPVDLHEIINLMLKFQQAFNKAYNRAWKNGFIGSVTDKDKIPHFVADNPIYTPIEINQMIQTGLSAGIITESGENKFDIEKWLYDENYRKATSTFYNLIKGSWNIFDTIEKTPHFKALFDLFRMSTQMINNNIKLAHVTWLMAKKLFGNEEYVDQVSLDKLQKYANDLLLLNWINNSSLTMSLFKDDKYFIDSFEERTSANNGLIGIETEAERATFKLRFEDMIEGLKLGFYKDLVNDEVKIIEDPKLSNNKFIKNLVSDINNDGFVFYKLNLDMQKVNSTPFNSKKYQECLDGFLQLKNFTFNGKPLTDWFMLYNFIVNRNMWGSDRLTSLFGPFINILKSEDSLIKRYYKDSGESDWNYIETINTIEDLEKIGFDEKDALHRIAPIITQDQEPYHHEKIIREYDEDGNLIDKLKSNSGQYFKIDYLDNSMLSLSSAEDALKRQTNYMNYSVIQTPYFNKRNSITGILNIQVTPDNYDESFYKLRSVLFDLLTNGILSISKANC